MHHGNDSTTFLPRIKQRILNPGHYYSMGAFIQQYQFVSLLRIKISISQDMNHDTVIQFL
jgi:hypothetical protein